MPRPAPSGGAVLPDPRIGRYLAGVYAAYHDAAFISPDPLEIVREYDDPRDREVAGLLCSSLALGRVCSILASARNLLGRLAVPPRAAAFLPPDELSARLAGFRHRFFSGDDVAALLSGCGTLIGRFGSLGSAFAAGYDPAAPDIVPAADAFVAALRAVAPPFAPNLLPRPAAASACKRLFLFLRWMVRRDRIDPGDWAGIAPPSALIVPLDTHMLAVGARLGFISGRQANLATARTLSEAFRAYDPEDPVRFDFSLTRMGINAACPDIGISPS